jgi:curli production assembly/transport component CsgE
LPQLGSRVSVLVNDFNIFEIDLPAKYDIIEEMALYAVESAKQFVVNYEQIQKDLEGSDLKGTGIF